MNSTNMLLENLQWAIAQTTDRMAASTAAKPGASSENAGFKKMLSEKTQNEAGKNPASTKQDDLTQGTEAVEEDMMPQAQALAAALMMQPAIVMLDENPASAAEALQMTAPLNGMAETTPMPQLAQNDTAAKPAPQPELANTAIPAEMQLQEPQVAEKPVLSQPVTAQPEVIAATEENAALQPARVIEPQTKKEEIPLDGDLQPVFGELEHLPVKVAEPQAVVEAETPDVEVQLAKQIDKACKNGATKLEIALSPETFGTVTVEMIRTEDGALRLMMTASTDRGQTLLEKHASGLQGMLAESNRAPVQVEVQRQSESQWTQHSYDREGGGGQQQQQRRQQHNENQDFLDRLRLGLTERESFTL